jgi:hypothetical protein
LGQASWKALSPIDLGWRPRGRGVNLAAWIAAFQLPNTRLTVCREGWFSPA